MNYELRLTGPETEITYVLTEGATVIGRDMACDIQLNHPRVLRRHVRLDLTDGELQATPLSRRSRIARGDDVLPAQLPTGVAAGDVLAFGSFKIEIVGVADAEEDAPVTEATPEEDAVALEPISQGAGFHGGNGGGSPPNTNLPDYLRNAPPPHPDYTRDIPAGLAQHSVRYINYLPELFRTDFTSRFVGLIEALYMPILWNVENFDMYLTPSLMPPEFLDWVSSWFGIHFDTTWSNQQRRTLLAEAPRLYAQRGTKKALVRMLEIYTGRTPEVIDTDDALEPFEFIVRLPLRERDVNRQLVERLIEAHKPAHTTYQLEFSSKVDMDVMFSRLDF